MNKQLYIKIQLLALLFIASSSYAFAQVQTTFRGVVLDSLTQSPIVGAIVNFDKTTIATHTAADGTFSLSNRRNITHVSVILMGYQVQHFTISAEKSTYKKIYLKVIDTELSEIIVKPKKEKYTKKNNPAVDLIKKVIENKSKNNIKAQEYYQYKEYERLILAFNDFNPKSGQFKKFDFLSNYVDSSIIDNKPFLPFSVKEKITDVFYRSTPRTEKRIIKGFKAEGIDQEMEQDGLEAFLQEAFKEVNIFDNYITMLLNNFVGPLSEHQATSFYKWYLGDTVQMEKDRYVKLDFAPFNNRDIGFTGSIYVSLDSTYAVKKAILRAPKNININWVTDMVVHQDFNKDENGIWVPQEYRTAIDMSLYEAMKVYVDKTVTIEDFVANIPIPPVYELPDPVLYEKDFKKRDDQFWITHRPEAHQTDYQMDEMIEELKKKSIVVRAIVDLGNILMTGYIPFNKDPDVNKFEIGTVPTFFSYNRVEGVRLRLAGTTTSNFHPHLFMYGYGAYGFKDQRFKYMSEVTWAFRKVRGRKEDHPRNNLTFSYRDDITALGQTFTQAERDNIFMSLSSSNKTKLTYNKRMLLDYHKEYHGGFSFKIGAQVDRLKPAQGVVFQLQDELGNSTLIHQVKTTEASLMLRYAHNEKFFQRRRRRMEIPSEKFIATLNHSIAIKDLFGGEYSYNKTSLKFEQSLWLTPYGKFKFILKGEKLWGKASFISLISPSVNSSFTLQDGSFYLAEPLEFIHDEQVSWEVYYHMGGWLFNRIPILKELRWREVLGFRGFYGRLSDKNNPNINRDMMVFPKDAFQTKNKEPYMEYNIGIENIFNFFRIDYVRRINYKGHPDISKDGVRFSFQFEF